MEDVNSNVEQGEEDTAKTNSATYVHKFKEPFEWEGTKYKTLNFYFDRLKGKDSVAVETDLNASGKYVLSQEISVDSLSRIAARAAGVFVDMILDMPMKDFNKIIGTTRSFLLDTE